MTVALGSVACGSSDSGKTKRAAGPPGTQTFGGLGRNHTDAPVAYPQTPPVGGNHSPRWQNCGFYSQPVPAERAVHSMEHGAVWITYRPGLAESDLSRLRKFAQEGYVLISPFEGLPGPVVATAWGRQLRPDSVQDPRLATFVSDFRRGPQTPEPGAPCTGGIGTPE